MLKKIDKTGELKQYLEDIAKIPIFFSLLAQFLQVHFFLSSTNLK